MTSQIYQLYTWLILGGLAVLMILLTLFAALLGMLLSRKGAKSSSKGGSRVPKKLPELLAIAKDPASKPAMLQTAIDSFLRFHGRYGKEGEEEKVDVEKEMEVLEMIVSNLNVTENESLQLQKTLVQNNPTYTKEITQAVDKGIKARK